MVGGLLQGRGGREGVGGDWGLLQGGCLYKDTATSSQNNVSQVKMLISLSLSS